MSIHIARAAEVNASMKFSCVRAIKVILLLVLGWCVFMTVRNHFISARSLQSARSRYVPPNLDPRGQSQTNFDMPPARLQVFTTAARNRLELTSSVLRKRHRERGGSRGVSKHGYPSFTTYRTSSTSEGLSASSTATSTASAGSVRSLPQPFLSAKTPRHVAGHKSPTNDKAVKASEDRRSPRDLRHNVHVVQSHTANDVDTQELAHKPKSGRNKDTLIPTHRKGQLHNEAGKDQNVQSDDDGTSDRVTSNNRRYLIYRCSATDRCGGLADRLKGIVLGYLLANVTGREFRVSMPMPVCDITDMLEERVIPWKVNVTSLMTAGSTRSSATYWRISARKRFSSELSNLDYRKFFGDVDVVFFRTNMERLPLLKVNPHHRADLQWVQPLDRSALYRMIITGLFKLAPPLQAQVDSVLSKARTGMKGPPLFVCAQIRMGRNPNMPNDTVVRVTSRHLPQIWQFMKQYSSNPAVSYFVSTDSNEVLQEATRVFDSRLVSVGGRIVHVDRPLERDDVCPGMRRVLVDLHVLTSCDVLLLTKSGIGGLAADLRGTETGLFCMSLTSQRIRECQP